MFKELQERGFIQQVTGGDGRLEELLSKEPVTFYLGIDPTGNSLHVGHLLPIMLAAWLKKAGHNPIVVIGGGTAMIGDPSGKNSVRKMLMQDEIKANANSLSKQLDNIISCKKVDNAEWLSNLDLLSFLRDIGSCFSINRMLSFEGYKQRMESGLSFLELSYQIMQSFDFLELNKRYNCTLQIGGDDQWSNIVSGIDLIRRKTGTEAHGLTVPLQLNSNGKKMGKTASGAVWLSPELMSPNDYFQFWLNASDTDVIRFLNLYTFLPLDKIAEFKSLSGKDLIKAKQTLAFEATSIVHGKASAEQAMQTSLGLSYVKFPIGNGVLIDLLVSVGFVDSRGHAKRIVLGNGVKVNGEKVKDPFHKVKSGSIVSYGKRKSVMVE